MKTKPFITTEVIEDIYRKECVEIDIKSSEKELKRFLAFLEIDIYDWVSGNLRYFPHTKE